MTVQHEHERSVKWATDYMADNLGVKVTGDDIARVMGFSKRQAQQVFCRVTGQTIGRYLSGLRYRQAAVLLQQHGNRMNVAAVAHTVGWSSVGSFVMGFHAFHGVPPIHYEISRCRCGRFDGVDHALAVWCKASPDRWPASLRHLSALDSDGKPRQGGDGLCRFCHVCLVAARKTNVRRTHTPETKK